VEGTLWLIDRDWLMLYDLENDVGETTDLSAQQPDIVRDLRVAIDEMADGLGDSARGIVGRSRRPSGEVADPVPLTAYDPTHPYLCAEYDLSDFG